MPERHSYSGPQPQRALVRAGDETTVKLGMYLMQIKRIM